MYIIFEEDELEKLTDDQRAELTSDDPDDDNPMMLKTSDTKQAAQFLGVDWTDIVPDDLDGENVQGLKNALKVERNSRKEFERNLKAANSRLVNSASADITREKDARIKTLEESLAEKDSTINGLETSIKTKDQDIRINSVVSKHKGDAELLIPHLRPMLEENPDLDLDDVMPTLKEKHPGAFRATSHSGGGSDPAHGGDGPSAFGGASIRSMATRRSEMTDRQKVDYQKDHGLDAFLDLPN